ncbi:conserved hypothetical protein [Cupriavidus phytorum]|uniref:Uncharacterized protein n=1 Tax=Cupriavidus taiwanensis TaxID=164546 RepID=A0A975X7C2_9BURK|nr:conserved hypothetical protein [Cupriavidus taiwanensis]
MVQVAVGGADDGNVDRHRLAAADARQAALLQHAQQPRLQRQRHISDLVEKQGAMVGLLDLADAAALAATGERAVGVAEQLRLGQAFRNRRTVQRDKGGARAAGVMQRARQQALAGAGLAQQNHRHLLADDGHGLVEGAREGRVGNQAVGAAGGLCRGGAVAARMLLQRDEETFPAARAQRARGRARAAVQAAGKNVAHIDALAAAGAQAQHLPGSTVGGNDHVIVGDGDDALGRRMEHAMVMMQMHDPASRQPRVKPVLDRHRGGLHAAERVGGQVHAEAGDVEHADQPVVAVVDRCRRADHVDELVQVMLATPYLHRHAPFAQHAARGIGAERGFAHLLATTDCGRSGGRRGRSAAGADDHACRVGAEHQPVLRGKRARQDLHVLAGGFYQHTVFVLEPLQLAMRDEVAEQGAILWPEPRIRGALPRAGNQLGDRSGRNQLAVEEVPPRDLHVAYQHVRRMPHSLVSTLFLYSGCQWGAPVEGNFM